MHFAAQKVCVFFLSDSEKSEENEIDRLPRDAPTRSTWRGRASPE